MQIGYNNDVKYREKTFHIQTEDRGEASASIETQIFHAGAILDTSIISYTRVLKSTEDIDERIEKIRALMQGNHKLLYKRLFAGDYDEMVGLNRLTTKAPAAVEDDFVPSQDAVPAAALEIERGNVTSLGEGHDGPSFGLAELQAQLNADAAAMEAATGAGGEDSEELPTIALSLNDVSLGDLSPGDAAASSDVSSTQQQPAIKLRGLPKPDVSRRDEGQQVARRDERQQVGQANYPRTGTSAWRGCDAIKGDADITKLVEAFIG